MNQSETVESVASANGKISALNPMGTRQASNN
jgi:hypothetical protein